MVVRVEVVNHISPLKHVHVFVTIAIVYLFHIGRLTKVAKETFFAAFVGVVSNFENHLQETERI